MLEDNAIRATLIGVGVFIVVITLTVIMLYVNAARELATSVQTNLNEWDEIDYTNIMDYNGNVTIDVTGIDLINFIRRYVGEDNVRIKVGQFTDSGDIANYEDLSVWKNDIGNASEEKLMNINPNAKLKMTKNILSDDTILITVDGDIWIIKQPEPGINYGDVDLSGNLDLTDYNFLNSYLTNILSEEQTVQADVNGDGIVNYTDYNILDNYTKAVAGIELKSDTGDVNLDTLINNLDVIELKKYVLNDVQRESADINLDRVVDKNDLNKLREELIKLGIEVPLEGSEEGEVDEE